MIVLCATTLVLAYGGVSCYVIVFVMYPIALNMFKKADLPRHLIPAIVAAGAFTAVNIGPGSPSVVNNIPVKYLELLQQCFLYIPESWQYLSLV